MNEPRVVPTRPILKRLLTPWGIATVILAAFFIGQAYLAWRDRAVKDALERDPAFAAPAFDISFSKHIAYDPLSFVGKGAQAGFWQWTPEALILTEAGRKYFEESGDRFISLAAAGNRRLKRIRSNLEADAGGERQIDFLYEWTEVSPPAAAMVYPPPRTGEEYPGSAIMTRDDGNWQVKSLRMRDFEEPMARLKMAASGIRK